jgi:hypothetical protein
MQSGIALFLRVIEVAKGKLLWVQYQSAEYPGHAVGVVVRMTR